MLTDSDTVTVFLDVSPPILVLLLTEDVNGNGILDAGEDITGDGELTVLPATTNNAVQTVFGTYEEDTPDLLTVTVNGKLVLSTHDFDPEDPTFSTTINLKSGNNASVVNLKDKGGLEPNQADTANNLSAQVILDITGPTLTALTTIYPFTAIAGTPGDPVVYQVNATDAETEIATVEIGVNGTPMFPASEIPEVLRDQWGITTVTDTFGFPTIIPTTAPPGGLSLTVIATHTAGNPTPVDVEATVTGSMTAWNTCLQRGGNLVALPIQPTDGSIATLLAQKVFNVDPTFKNGLVAAGHPRLQAKSRLPSELCAAKHR